MKRYWVEIRATVYKVIEVEAEDEAKAQDEAHERFNLEFERGESYRQETVCFGEVL